MYEYSNKFRQWGDPLAEYFFLTMRSVCTILYNNHFYIAGDEGEEYAVRMHKRAGGGVSPVQKAAEGHSGAGYTKRAW